VGYWLLMPRVHLENLPKVRSGMTLAEVEKLLGPGEVVATTKVPSGKAGKTSVSKTVRWHAEKDGAEQEVSLAFLDDKVMVGFGPKDDVPSAGNGSDVMSKMEELAKKLGESPELKKMLSSAAATTSPDKAASPVPASSSNAKATANARQQTLKGRTTPGLREMAGAIADLDGALAGLKSGGFDQIRALDWLIATTPDDSRRQEVITALTPLVDGQGVLDRTKAAGALAAWSGQAQLDLLVRELDQSDEGVRRAVLGALGRLRDPRAAPAIAQRLLVPADRGNAGRALTAMGAEAAPVVQPFLQSQDREVRSEAARILRTLGALDADAVRMLALADLQDRDHGVRVRALQDLARAAPSPTDPHRAEAAAILVGLLNDSQMSIRVGAAKALAAWAVPDNVPVLLDALSEQNGDLRRAAMEALGRLGDKRTVPAMARHLLDGGDRAQATRSLQALGPMAEAETLHYLQHRDGAVRAAACRVLQSAGTRKSVQPLRYIASNDRNRESARAAAEALDGIARRKSAK
jgi:HEAT repeat protein